MTIDYDFWVNLPERPYAQLLTLVQRLGGSIMARALYELPDGIQVNAIFKPDGLRSFDTAFKGCRLGRLEGRPVRVLPLARVIASKRAAGREKDLAALPILERTLRLKRCLKAKKHPPRKKK